MMSRPEVILYNSTCEVYDLSFISERDIPVTVICPNANISDNFRDKVQKYSDFSLVNVLTISKFVNDQVKKSFSEEEFEAKNKSKAELILHLSVLWKKYFPEKPFDTFMQAFNLFTELRSFTLDLSLVLEIFQEYDTSVTDAVKIFWHEMQTSGLMDEHQGYSLLKRDFSKLKNEEKIKNCQYLVWGFDHLSSGQIDLLNEISQSDQVYIPFPRDVFKKSKNSDWINWLDTSLESDNKEKLEKKPFNCKIINFSKNRLGEKMTNYFNKNELKKRVNVYLAQKNPGFEEMNEIPMSNLYFRSNTDFFSLPLENLFKIIKVEFGLNFGELATKDGLISFLKDLLQKEIEKDFSKKDLREIKVLLSVLESIDLWENVPNQSEGLLNFDLVVLESICKLNLPRNYSIPALMSEKMGRIFGSEGLDNFEAENINIVCASSYYKKMKSGNNILNEDIIKTLISLGPLKSPDLEFNLVKFRMGEILHEPSSILFMENGLEKDNPEWEEILSSQILEKIECQAPRKNDLKNNPLEEVLLNQETPYHDGISLSATKLQSFIDCPRKYYFQYVDRVSKFPKLINNVLPNQMGIIEHNIIEKFLKENPDWDEDLHLKTTRSSLTEFCENERIKLTELNFETLFIELRDYTKKAIKNLLRLKNLGNGEGFKFEEAIKKNHELEKLNFSGSIDCLFEFSGIKGLLDFKRSKSGIPTQKEMDSFEKIQLYFYLLHGNLSPEELSIWGFLNISDPKESLIFVKNEEIKNSLIGLKFLEGANLKISPENGEILKKYKEFEDLTIKSIKSEKEFAANPLSETACRFCIVKNVCPKGKVL